MELKACIINKETHIVENVIVVAGGVWKAPDHCYLILSDQGSIGDKYDEAKAKFLKPVFENPSETTIETPNENSGEN